MQFLNNPLEGLQEAFQSFTPSFQVRVLFVGASSLGNVMARTHEGDVHTIFLNSGYPMSEIIAALVDELTRLILPETDQDIMTVKTLIWSHLIPPKMDDLRDTSILLKCNSRKLDA